VYHRLRPKWFLGLWYVWRKPSVYLAPTLTPSPNGLKQDSKWPTSPRSSIGSVQNDFWACGTFGVNHVPILHQDWHYLQSEWIKLTTWASPPRSIIWVHPKLFLNLWCVWCKPCTYIVLTLILSPNRPKQDSTWPKSPSSYIRCEHNGFRFCGTLGAKCAPIIRQD
jgi:hypothetical protein